MTITPITAAQTENFEEPPEDDVFNRAEAALLEGSLKNCDYKKPLSELITLLELNKETISLKELFGNPSQAQEIAEDYLPLLDRRYGEIPEGNTAPEMALQEFGITEFSLPDFVNKFTNLPKALEAAIVLFSKNKLPNANDLSFLIEGFNGLRHAVDYQWFGSSHEETAGYLADIVECLRTIRDEIEKKHPEHLLRGEVQLEQNAPSAIVTKVTNSCPAAAIDNGQSLFA